MTDIETTPDPDDPAFSDPDRDPEGFPEHGDGEASADAEAEAAAAGEEE